MRAQQDDQLFAWMRFARIRKGNFATISFWLAREWKRVEEQFKSSEPAR
jgi:hypothetical protein